MASNAPARSPSRSEDRYNRILTALKAKRGTGNRLPLELCLAVNALPGSLSPAGISRPTGLFSSVHVRKYRHIGSLGSGFEGDGAFHRGEDRVIDADPHTRAGMPLGPALTHNDVAGEHVLT